MRYPAEGLNRMRNRAGMKFSGLVGLSPFYTLFDVYMENPDFQQ